MLAQAVVAPSPQCSSRRWLSQSAFSKVATSAWSTVRHGALSLDQLGSCRGLDGLGQHIVIRATSSADRRPTPTHTDRRPRPSALHAHASQPGTSSKLPSLRYEICILPNFELKRIVNASDYLNGPLVRRRPSKARKYFSAAIAATTGTYGVRVVANGRNYGQHRNCFSAVDHYAEAFVRFFPQ